ncbi:hypothetical protein HYX18_02850, partial [Candidatus Woesearchaeota archaeon]|nr:hypothetical protein [Candidatus Woesearchaeota archaeon]
YAILNLITTSILGSLVLGLIARGKAKYGARYIPIIVTFSLLIFFLVRKTVSSLLGDVFGLA